DPRSGVLRPGQDRHRQVQRPGLRPAVLQRWADQPPCRAQDRLCAAGVLPRRCRRPADGAAARPVDGDGHRLGRGDRARDRPGDAARDRRPARLRGGRRPDRGASRRRSRDRHRLQQRGGDGRTHRRDARRRPCRGHADGDRGRALHRRDLLLRLRREQGGRDARDGRRRRLRPRRLLRLQRLDHRPAHALRRRASHGRQPRPRAPQGRARAWLAGPPVHPPGQHEGAVLRAPRPGGHRGCRRGRRRRRRARLVRPAPCAARRARRRGRRFSPVGSPAPPRRL
ncbi:MAG: Phosphoserine phosphatase, partial [uncultured Blastococcus sp.]